ncbi:hypothetical protein CAC42_4292 [Sphaceloma murrayae]|uniref:Uncharacterized protein n=1 Tax=Sphaceloma murrayae TaxID=2082308 RepID=A0A2K1QLT8_9PEZI|nr:hypothetical protein CAC42_4292 [Sphaceloma murrayae]
MASSSQAKQKTDDKAHAKELLAQLFPEQYAPKVETPGDQLRLEELRQSISRPPKEQKTATQIEVPPTKWDKKSQIGAKGVLKLSRASQNLAPEDFQRLMPQAKKLFGWNSRLGAIEKIIPAREMDRLERKGSYYLIFESTISAEEYRRRASRIAQLYDIYGPTSRVSDRPIPKNLILPGELAMQLVKTFTLLPPSQPLELELVRQPYDPALADLIQHGGYGKIVKRPWKAPAEVILRAGLYHLSYGLLHSALRAAEHERNLPWTGNRFGDFKLSAWNNEPKGRNADETQPEGGGPRQGDNEGGPVGTSRVEGKPPVQMPKVYLVGLETTAEAEAFARHFHRRELVNPKAEPSAEPIVLDAEVLW